MGWFSKKEEIEKSPSLPPLPKLPEFPKFPELPKIERDHEETKILPQLPSIPNNSFGKRFSQDAIKGAVTGREEEGENEFTEFNKRIQTVPDFPSEDSPPEIHFPFKRSVEERIKEVPEKSREIASGMKLSEPVFVRIDKFEEGLKNLEEIKEQIKSIEKMIKDIRRTKEDEEKELVAWERELKTVKVHIENIDRNIFSKVR